MLETAKRKLEKCGICVNISKENFEQFYNWYVETHPIKRAQSTQNTQNAVKREKKPVTLGKKPCNQGRKCKTCLWAMPYEIWDAKMRGKFEKADFLCISFASKRYHETSNGLCNACNCYEHRDKYYWKIDIGGMKNGKTENQGAEFYYRGEASEPE